MIVIPYCAVIFHWYVERLHLEVDCIEVRRKLLSEWKKIDKLKESIDSVTVLFCNAWLRYRAPSAPIVLLANFNCSISYTNNTSLNYCARKIDFKFTWYRWYASRRTLKRSHTLSTEINKSRSRNSSNIRYKISIGNVENESIVTINERKTQINKCLYQIWCLLYSGYSLSMSHTCFRTELREQEKKHPNIDT